MLKIIELWYIIVIINIIILIIVVVVVEYRVSVSMFVLESTLDRCVIVREMRVVVLTYVDTFHVLHVRANVC